jgi:uncharacterized protein (DUF58 family)
VGALSAAEARRAERRVTDANRLTHRVKAGITRRTGLTASGLVVLALAVIAWLIGYTLGGRPLYLLSYACLAVLGLAFALTSRVVDLEGSRTAARPRVAEGETIQIEIGLSGRKRFTTFVLDEELPPVLGENPRISVASFAPGDEFSHSYELTFWRRGSYRLGPLVVRWSDPFGLTQRRRVLAEPFEVLVHPSTELVQDRPLTRLWEDPPVRPPISKPWPTGSEFYGMREYARGDDPRRVVWRAYARTGRILVRESEQGVTDKLTILLDTDRSTHSKGAVSASFEVAVKTAASIAVRYLRQGYDVTLETNEAKLVGPVRGPSANLPLLDQLARAERGRTPLADGLIRMVFDSRRDAQIILITPHVDRDTAARLRLLIDRGSSVTVVALVWDEDAVDTLSAAAALGAQVVEIRPNTSVSGAFAHAAVGIGR